METKVYPADDFNNFWPVDFFKEKYSTENGIRSCFIASKFSPDYPDQASLIVIRSFIENGERAKSKEGQKYIIGLRFYSFGDLATIDLISLDKDFHREICYEHIKRMGWPIFSPERGPQVNFYQETLHTPVIFSGGFLKISPDDKIDFLGQSGDYGGKIFFSNTNQVSHFIESLSEGDMKGGLIEYLLNFMYENKLKKTFYSDLIKDLYANQGKIELSSQNIGALINMKVIDRYVLGEGNILALTVEEFSGGLAQDIMLQKIVASLNNK